MLQFYGLQLSEAAISKGPNWLERKSNWFTEPTHNSLRCHSHSEESRACRSRGRSESTSRLSGAPEQGRTRLRYPKGIACILATSGNAAGKQCCLTLRSSWTRKSARPFAQPLVAVRYVLCTKNVNLRHFRIHFLTPQLKELVRAKVDSGMYSSASEVVRKPVVRASWLEVVRVMRLNWQMLGLSNLYNL
jgi:hypothetical protein